MSDDDRKILTLPSQLTSIRRYVDNSGGITFRSTLELSLEDMAVMDAFLRDKTPGYLQFARNRLSASDLPKEDAPGEQKSKAQIQRGLLFYLWRDGTDQSEDAEAYYRRRMDKNLEKLRTELEQLHNSVPDDAY